MAKITHEEIIKLAHMSQIQVAEHEIPMLFEKIEAVLNYASSLKEIAAGHNESAMPRNINIMREDAIKPTDPAPLLKQAPQCEEHYFAVPVILKS